MKLRYITALSCLIFASQAFAMQGGHQQAYGTYTYRSHFRQELHNVMVAREAPVVEGNPHCSPIIMVYSTRRLSFFEQYQGTILACIVGAILVTCVAGMFLTFRYALRKSEEEATVS